jgi:hypothetical protein
MDRQYLLYTIKVWLSGVLVTPAIVTIICWIPGSDRSLSGTAIIPFYLLLAAFEFMFSFFTWLMFWALSMLIVFYINNIRLRRWLNFIASIVLTIITFAAFSWLMFSILFDAISLALMLINCVCIGWGTWFFYPADLVELTGDTLEPESYEK